MSLKSDQLEVDSSVDTVPAFVVHEPSQSQRLHLTKFLIGHSSNSLFFPSTNNIEMNFCIKLYILM